MFMHKDPVTMHIINVISQQFFGCLSPYCGCRLRTSIAAIPNTKYPTSCFTLFFFLLCCNGIGCSTAGLLVRMVMAVATVVFLVRAQTYVFNLVARTHPYASHKRNMKYTNIWRLRVPI